MHIKILLFCFHSAPPLQCLKCFMFIVVKPIVITIINVTNSATLTLNKELTKVTKV